MTDTQTFPTEKLATVGSGGKIEVLGRAYWSPKMCNYIGWTVRVMVPKDEHEAIQVWRGSHFLASADRIADASFLDFDRARTALAGEKEKAKARRTSIVRRQAELLVELIDDATDHRSMARVAILNFLTLHGVERLQKLIVELWDRIFDHKGHRTLKRAERRETRLRLAERIFELPYAIFSDHPDLPSIDAMREAAERDFDEEASRVAEAGHRLSGDAK